MRKEYLLVPVIALLATGVGVAAYYQHKNQQSENPTGEPTPLAETGALFRFAAVAPPGEATPDAALSLTASDGTGLKLTSYDSRGIVQGPLAFTELKLTFDNPESRTLEGTFRITLPQGAAISRFAMRQERGWQEGEIVEKQEARRAYEDFLHRKQDPALLEQAAGNEFSARVFPIPANGRKELIVSWSEELSSQHPYTVRLLGLPEVANLDAVVSGTGEDAPILGRIHFENAKPDRDLVVDASKLSLGAGVRAGELVMLRVLPATRAGADPLRSAVVMVDTSASRALGFERQLQWIGDLVAKLEPATRLIVAAFDQGIDIVYEGQASGYAEEGMTRLRERQAFGASDIAAALGWAAQHASSIQADRVILVSDGVPTKGMTEPDDLAGAAKALARAGVRRIDTIAVGGIRDEARLRRIATSGLERNGVVVDGARSPELGFARLSSATRDVMVKIDGATWQWPRRLDGVQPGDEALIYASVPTGTAPRVDLGDGAKGAADIIDVDPPLLERAWARAKIDQLMIEPPSGVAPETVKDEIVRLSKKHRVLSPHTALLVLETEADYRRYKIERNALADILTVEGTRLVRTRRSEDLVLGDGSSASPSKKGSDGVVLDAPPAPNAPSAPEVAAEAAEVGRVSSKAGAGVAAAPAPPATRAAASELEEVARLGSSGHGAGAGTAQGFGVGHGRLSGSHRTRPPRLRMEATTVRGSMPPEVIQRIVRQNYGRIRLCYENGLRSNPNLEGRVVTKFVIGRDGSVMSAVNQRSTMPAPNVLRCVVGSFKLLSFPAPETGTVTVVFPITLSLSGVNAFPAQPATPPVPVDPYEGKLAEIMTALKKGDKEGALTMAMAFRQARPGDVIALVALGEVFEARGEVRSAARAYGSIIDLFSSRADLRRMAGQRLERLDADYALRLAQDSYEKAVLQRPDHPASHRLLAYARLRTGDPAGAFDAIEKGVKRNYPEGRFRGASRILQEDMALIGTAWIKMAPSKRPDVERRLAQHKVALDTTPSVRFVLLWETDANDVDFHIRDAKGGHAYYSQKKLASGGELYEDVTTGYGPECFTVPLPREKRSGPYKLQAHYYSRGPMGYGMGKLEILEHDGHGGLTFEERPFVVMQDRAYVDLGTYPADAPPSPAWEDAASRAPD